MKIKNIEITKTNRVKIKEYANKCLVISQESKLLKEWRLTNVIWLNPDEAKEFKHFLTDK